MVNFIKVSCVLSILSSVAFAMYKDGYSESRTKDKTVYYYDRNYTRFKGLDADEIARMKASGIKNEKHGDLRPIDGREYTSIAFSLLNKSKNPVFISLDNPAIIPEHIARQLLPTEYKILKDRMGKDVIIFKVYPKPHNSGKNGHSALELEVDISKVTVMKTYNCSTLQECTLDHLNNTYVFDPNTTLHITYGLRRKNFLSNEKQLQFYPQTGRNNGMGKVSKVGYDLNQNIETNPIQPIYDGSRVERLSMIN